jgi:hypothetical protein
VTRGNSDRTGLRRSVPRCSSSTLKSSAPRERSST